jgi:hypothetical protein
MRHVGITRNGGFRSAPIRLQRIADVPLAQQRQNRHNTVTSALSPEGKLRLFVSNDEALGNFTPVLACDENSRTPPYYAPANMRTLAPFPKLALSSELLRSQVRRTYVENENALSLLFGCHDSFCCAA